MTTTRSPVKCIKAGDTASSFRTMLLFAKLALLAVSAATAQPFVQYEWNYVNLTWPSAEAYREAVDTGAYIQENNPLAGIKLWKDTLYLTVPRWKDGVPATLVATSVEPIDGNRSPLLRPYPSWEMQKIGDCRALQFVQSMEIDPLGRMWVLDTGRVATRSEHPRNLCQPRLLIFDLESGEIVLEHKFPKDVASRETGYLNDIVLEHEDGGYAFITNTDTETPGVIVFSLKDNKSWLVRHKSMEATAVEFTVLHDNVKVAEPLNVDGIAISPSALENQRILYYTPLSSLEVFSVPTRVLKHHPEDIDAEVKLSFRKHSQTDGMMMTADGRLFYGLLANNTVNDWDDQFARDDETLQWPDTFAIDVDGRLWCVSNRLQRQLTDTVNVDEVNSRVVILDHLDVKSYLYYKNGSAPKWPSIA